MNNGEKKVTTGQDLFETAIRGIIAQGGPAFMFDAPNFLCMYRGPNGTKCAFGHAIPDALYRPDFERSRAGPVMEDIRKQDYAFLDGIPLHFVNELQRTHDRAAELMYTNQASFWFEFRSNLREFAAGYSLDDAILDDHVLWAGKL